MQTEFAALIAIDWADRKHAWALQIPGSSNRETGTVDHTPEAVDVWAAELRLRFGGQPIAVALEQSRGPLVFTLTKYEHFIIFPVHPTALVNYRKSFRPSGAKDDPSDAGLLLDILMLHRDKLRRLNPDTAETRTLQFMVEERRKLVHEKTRYSNRITAHLKMYFPQALGWFDEIGSNIAADFLERWPSLAQLQRARPATIERFFIDHNSRDHERIAERLEEIRKAIPATTDAAVLASCGTAVVAWVGLLRELLAAITVYDEKIDALARAHPDYALMNSFPGAGPALTPRLIAAMGSQREPYQLAHEIQWLQRDCARSSHQRPTTLGALALGLPQISSPDLS
jgi:Transposase